MAISDIYELKWRTEQAGVVMNNSLNYRQDNNDLGTFSGPAQALTGALVNEFNNIRSWLLGFLGTDARVTAAASRKVVDNSATGPEEAVIAIDDMVGTLPGTCAPSQLWNFVLFRGVIIDNQNVWRNLYIGGISESALGGVKVNNTIWEQARQNFNIWVSAPEIDLDGNQPFSLVIPSSADPDASPVFWDALGSVNPAFFLTRKNSRRLRAAL